MKRNARLRKLKDLLPSLIWRRSVNCGRRSITGFVFNSAEATSIRLRSHVLLAVFRSIVAQVLPSGSIGRALSVITMILWPHESLSSLHWFHLKRNRDQLRIFTDQRIVLQECRRQLFPFPRARPRPCHGSLLRSFTQASEVPCTHGEGARIALAI